MRKTAFCFSGDEKYRPIMTEMQKIAPVVFAPPVTPKIELKLFLEGDKFHWGKLNAK